MIKRILASLVVLLLSGCVYYVPYEVAVSTPSADQAVVYEEPAVVYESYVVSPYYPWASVDYFYLGNNYYRPYSGVYFPFGFYMGSGWYPPSYYNPYYYSAWYRPFYGFPYPYYGIGYDPWYHHYPHHVYQPRHDDDHGGYQGGGHGAGGAGHFDRGPNGNNPGNGGDGSTRAAGHSTLDRHVPIQRQPGRPDRNVSSTPSANGGDRGMTIVNRGDRKMQPNHTQPAGNTGYYGRSNPVAPVDRSAVSGQKGQPQAVQPRQNQAAPAQTGIPSGFSRPVPLESSGGKQQVVRQAPAELAPQPSLNQQMAPQPVQSAPAPDTSRRPDGGFQRSEHPRDDRDGGFNRGDRHDG